MEKGQIYIAGTWLDGEEIEDVRNPFDQQIVGTVALGTEADVGRAIEAAERALAVPFHAHERYRVLSSAAQLIEDTAHEIAELIAQEGSKTIREARREPPRAADILRLSADAARRVVGKTLPMDIKPGSETRTGFWERIPVGVVGAILPFNDPMAVAAHKIGPALAAGNAVVLKPDSRTPFSVLRMAQALHEAGLPPGRLNVVTGSGDPVGTSLVADPRVRLISFTGGAVTGAKIAARAGVKKLVLELGANSAVIVMADADLDRAVPAIVAGAYAQGGQNCLGVQRVLIERAVYDDVKQRLVNATRTLKAGHSLDATVDVCAMIRESEAARVQSWIDEAVEAGARVLVGGTRTGAVIWPTILEDVPAAARLSCDEVYGPVMILCPVDSLDEAIRQANGVAFGLHAAIFTASLSSALSAARQLQVGGVIINDSTDYRVDTMPFGGLRMSGLGREGIEHAVASMTETRTIIMRG